MFHKEGRDPIGAGWFKKLNKVNNIFSTQDLEFSSKHAEIKIVLSSSIFMLTPLFNWLDFNSTVFSKLSTNDCIGMSFRFLLPIRRVNNSKATQQW